MMFQSLAIDIENGADFPNSEEMLLTTPFNLASLGVERTDVEQRAVVFCAQEQLAAGRLIDVPAQVAVDADEQDQAILTWMAPPASVWPRRFVFDVVERSHNLPGPFPRVQVIPDTGDCVQIADAGREMLGYCYSTRYPKPFFFPVFGPSGRPVTRLGHPRDFGGGHDHHRSLWIEHENVNNVCFETEHLRFFEGTDSPIVGIGEQIHRGFLKQEDGPIYASLAMAVDWVSHSGEVLLTEERRVRVYPLAGDEQLIDFDLTFRPQVEQVIFGKSTFGVLAVRMAHSLEVTRGGGGIRNARGGLNEAELHRQPAEWCDYAGPVTPDDANGLAIFDHPDNIHHPALWHVRDDGWMCVAPFGREAVTIAGDESLNLRYRVFVHAGNDVDRIAARYAEYAHPPAMTMEIRE